MCVIACVKASIVHSQNVSRRIQYYLNGFVDMVSVDHPKISSFLAVIAPSVVFCIVMNISVYYVYMMQDVVKQFYPKHTCIHTHAFASARKFSQ